MGSSIAGVAALGRARSREVDGRTASAPQTAARTSTSLRIRDLGKSFGGVTAVDTIDLDVAAGEIRAIIGPNGAGKSTLLNLISGLYRPDRGSIHIGDVQQPRANQLARLGVARTFQNLALFEGLNVFDNVAMGLAGRTRATTVERLVGLGRIRQERVEMKSRVDAILGFFELGAFRDRFIGSLPYGVRKSVELARALVAEPRLLLLDEPLAGMSREDKPAMARFIRAARDSYGATVVLIEHDVGVVMGLADRVAVLDYGRKIADGKPDEVRRDPAVITAYLGTPHTDEQAA